MTDRTRGHRPRKPRVLKSPKQRAEEALASAQRAHDSALKHRDAARAAAQAAEERYTGSLALLNHAKSHPALNEPTLPLGGA